MGDHGRFPGITRRTFVQSLSVTAAGGLAAVSQGAHARSARVSGNAFAKRSLQENRFEGVTLRISTQSGPSTDAWKPLLPAFEEEYGANVEIEETPINQIQAKQFAEAQANTGAYDLIDLQSFDLGKFVVGDVLADLTPLFEDSSLVDSNYDIDDFAQVMIEGYCKYEVNGERRLYAVPHKFDIYLAMYRPDLFDAAGIPHPSESFTYDDLIGIAGQLQEQTGDSPAVTMALQAPGPAFTTWSAIYRSHGGEYFDQNKYPLFNNEAGVAAVETLKALLPYMPIDALSLAFDPAVRIVAQGGTAFAENWNSFLPTLLDPDQSTVADMMAFMPTPAGPERRAQELGGWVVGISSDSTNKEAAFLLLQHLTSKETAVQYALAGGSSARTSVAANEEVVEQIPYYPLMIAALEDAVPRPNDPSWGEVQGIIGTAVNSALQEGADPQQILTEAAQSVYETVQRMGFQPEVTGPAPGN